ncbi:hypothetical protein PVAND_014353 [Polypedilum vanderplanki]|uniref:Uncharacterized protein n=1 Tax=Polypedilum vanderplanki TaxID=319348 RepID=A0A9J6CSH9_POLVA|nr:hypothetical protein PVAND_014353 [Polypedilum vanderplanki]
MIFKGYVSDVILDVHVFVLAQPSPFSFKNQFIGNYSNYVTAEEELRRSFCNNYWCTNDAHYLFTKSSQYPNVDPCVDFKNFTVNQVEEVDVPDDRKLYRGFFSTVEDKYFERLRKVVAAKFDPIKDENSRIIKIVKNTFSQCLKSKHALRHIQAHKDIVEHLQSLGGSPYLSKHIHFNRDKFNETTDFGIDDLWTNNVPNSFNEDELWTGEDFNVSRYFEVEPNYSLNIFFDLGIKRCKNDILCLLKPESSWSYLKDEEYDFETNKELFRTLDDAFRMGPRLKKLLIEQVYWPAVKRKRNFLKNRNEIMNQYKKNETTNVKIKDLQDALANKLEIDWLQVVNSELFEESKLTENDEIFIEGGTELLQKLMENLIETDKKTIADTFHITFLYRYRSQIILRFHNRHDLTLQGYKHGWQRWTTCIRQYALEQYMEPALLVMHEQKREIWDRTLGDFDRDSIDERIDIVGSAEKFILEAVDEFKRRFLTEGASKLSTEISADVVFKLKNIKILIGLPKSVFSISKLEEFYKNLNLTGNENFMKSLWEIQRHHRKLRNEPKNNWRRQIEQIVEIKEYYKYYVDDGNIFYVTPAYTIYPFYHPLRPRFFNMATLFKYTLVRLLWDVRKYISDHYKIEIYPYTEDPEQISYEHYKNWLKNHTELQIGGNYLTNEQLFWVAHAVSGFNKYHKTVPGKIDERNRLISQYMHVRLKNMNGFQEAFQCNMTANEIKTLTEYYEKDYALL